MGYTEITDNDVDLDSPGREDTIFDPLRLNSQALRFGYLFPKMSSGNTANSTWTSLGTIIKVDVPNLPAETGYTRQFIIGFQGKADAGTSDFVIEDSASGDTGTAVTTSATSFTDLTASLDITDSWAGTQRTLRLLAKSATSDTSTAKIEDVDGGASIIYF